MEQAVSTATGLTTVALVGHLNIILAGIEPPVTVKTCYKTLVDEEINSPYVYCLLEVGQLQLRPETEQVHQRFVALHKERTSTHRIAISYLYPTVYQGDHNSIVLLELKAQPNWIFEYNWHSIKDSDLPLPYFPLCRPPTYVWTYIANDPLITLSSVGSQRRFQCVGIEEKRGFHGEVYLSFHLVSRTDTTTDLTDIFLLIERGSLSAHLATNRWELVNVVRRVYTHPLDANPTLTRIVAIYKKQFPSP